MGRQARAKAAQESDDLIITATHVQNTQGYCLSGARHFARLHGLDFRDFVRGGISAKALAATGDALALALIEKIRAQAPKAARG